MLPRGLLARSLLIIVIPLVLLQVITTYVFFDRHWDVVSRRLNSAVASEIGLVARLIETYPDEGLQAWAFSIARMSQSLTFTFSPGEGMPPIAPSDSDPIERALTRQLGPYLPHPFVVDGRPGDTHLTVYMQTPRGILEVDLPKKRLFTESIFLFMFWIVATSLILFGVATIFMRNQVRPMLRLARAADAFGKGREAAEVRIEGATEVRKASRAFKAMRERIKRQIDQRTAMLAGVSHDLRTPLTRMKLQLALLDGARKTEDAEDAKGIEDLRADVAEMECMIDAYLDFVRGSGTETAIEADLAATVNDVVGRHRRGGGQVTLSADKPIILPLKRQAFERAFGNILGNALRHGHQAWVRAGVRHDQVEILVDDDGPGIPKARREEVFKAFYRLESSRNPGTGGMGLGLTIARDLVRGMGGDVILTDSPRGGLRVRMVLPL
nr:ATP-binding protein [Roseospira visakhapatnamensis]